MNAYIVTPLGAKKASKFLVFAATDMGARKKIKEYGFFLSIPIESLSANRYPKMDKHSDGKTDVFKIESSDSGVKLKTVDKARKKRKGIDLSKAVDLNPGTY